MTPQLKAAMVRSLIGGVLSAVLVLLTTLQTTGNAEEASLAAGVALTSYLIARGVMEGWLDSTRAEAGAVLPADVGSNLILPQRQAAADGVPASTGSPELPPADAPHGA